MINKKEKETALVSSVGADEKQSLSNNFDTIIPDFSRCFNMNDYEKTLHTVSLTELYDTAYQPKARIIDGLLYAGTYIFAGVPKVGKSFFMAGLGYHVSTGTALWNYPVHQGSVLYLALEDNYARLQKRLSRMFGTTPVDKLYFATHAKNLNDGLDGQLKLFIEEHPDTKLIMIDTLQKIREIGGEQYSYASDYDIVTKLKKFSDEHNICVLVVHHTRKQTAEDCFDTISGTNGLLGAADGAFIMQKEKRTENRAVLDIVGRDQQDQRLYLLFERERCLWELTKAELELWKESPEPILEAVCSLFNSENFEWCGNATELIEALKLSDIQPNVLSRKLNINADRLWNEYQICLESKRTQIGRQIRLVKIKSDDIDGYDDISDIDSGL